MALLAASISHDEAPIELREQLAIPPAQLDEAIRRLDGYVPEGIILSTCNRTEVYATVGHRGSGLKSITHFLSAMSSLDESLVAEHLRSYWQEEAVRHLFRVAAGLESMIVGEGQILGQVREAYELGTRGRSAGAVLSRLFTTALQVGKRARTETAIARNAVSISQAAVEAAARAVGSLREATVLVIGAGKMGELAARTLHERAAGRLILMNRTLSRAEALVERLGGEAWPLEQLDEALTLADVVMTSAATEHYLLDAEHLAGLLGARGGRPLVVVDIAVPRNVDPAAAELSGVRLFNVDDLREVCAANLGLRRREAEKVEAILDEELARFVRWWQAREVAPTIGALVQKAEAIRQEELSRALGRLGPLSERERDAINALTVGIVNKMLHAPITRMKERGAGMDGKHYLHAVRELFDLPPAELAVE